MHYRLHEILALGEIDGILRASVPDSTPKNISGHSPKTDRSAVPALLNDKTQFIDSYVRSSECHVSGLVPKCQFND